MEQALRPHRGGTVLALGILSLIAGLFFLPLGIVAWVMGSRDLKRMNEGQVDPAGRSLTQIGRVFGIGSLFMWILSSGCVALMIGGTRYRAASSSSYSMGDGTRTVKTYFSQSSEDRIHQTATEYEYQEVERPNGAWVKEGPAMRWSRDGKKLEQGSYRDGKREGEWTYWNKDGSIDPVRSGIYENDVRVQEGARPAGY
jgi:hypothetical protein